MLLTLVKADRTHRNQEPKAVTVFMQNNKLMHTFVIIQLQDAVYNTLKYCISNQGGTL